MQVKELIEKLKAINQDAYVVVGHDIIHDIGIVKGRVEVGYYNPQFFMDDRKVNRDEAVVFMRNTELTDGTVESMSI